MWRGEQEGNDTVLMLGVSHSMSNKMWKNTQGTCQGTSCHMILINFVAKENIWNKIYILVAMENLCVQYSMLLRFICQCLGWSQVTNGHP